MKILLKCYKYKKDLCKTRRWYSKSELKPPWNVLFFGTDKFSLASLEALNNERKTNSSLIGALDVVTTIKNNCINAYAKKQQLKVKPWPLMNLNDLYGYQIGVVVSFGHLIPKDIIDAFPMGMINVHASLLPRWQGAAPIIHALAAGDSQTGVTIMKIRPFKFDIGEIIHQEAMDVTNEMCMPKLHHCLALLGAKNLVQVLQRCPEILSTAVPQNKELITFAPKVQASMANIDFSLHTGRHLFNLSRALYELHPLVASFNKKKIKIHHIVGYEHEAGLNVVVGTMVYDKFAKILRIAVKDGWILVDKIAIHGKKVMNAHEFNNGYLRKTQIVLQNGVDIT